MPQSTIQYILEKIREGNLAPARHTVEAFKVHNRKHRDELYHICSQIQSLSTQQALPGGEEIAVSGYEKILNWKALDRESAINLSVILMRWKHLDRAKELLESLYTAHPSDMLIAVNLGTLYIKNEQLEEALSVFKKCLEVEPNNSDCYNNLAMIMVKLNNHKLALDYYNQAIKLDPLHKTAYIGLSKLLFHYDLKTQAYRAAEAAAKLAPTNPQTYANLASMFYQDERKEEAAEMCRIALRVDPHHHSSLQLLSKILVTKGEIKQSERLFDSIAEHRNNDILSITKKLSLSKKPLSEAEKTNLLQIVSNGTASDRDILMAYNALSHSAELEKDYEREIEFLRKAKHHKFKSNTYNKSKAKTQVNIMRARFGIDFFRQYPKYKSSQNEPIPIFIIGAPRSGSTLTEQIISSHPDVTATGESGYLSTSLSEIHYFDWLAKPKTPETLSVIQSVHNAYSCLLERNHPDIKSFFSDKSLFNFLHIGLLYLAFPDAKFINCVRNPIDNCLGIFKTTFEEDSLDFADSIDTTVEFYKAYQTMMEHWDSVLPGVVYHSHYEALIGDFESQARKLIDHCGLPWNDDCLRFYENKREVKTASVLQVRQPIYTSAVARWRRYEPYIQDLISKINEAGIKM